MNKRRRTRCAGRSQKGIWRSPGVEVGAAGHARHSSADLGAMPGLFCHARWCHSVEESKKLGKTRRKNFRSTLNES